MPTVAPKMPRETSVGFAGVPSLVLILGKHKHGLTSLSQAAYHPLTVSTSIPYPTSTRFPIVSQAQDHRKGCQIGKEKDVTIGLRKERDTQVLKNSSAPLQVSESQKNCQ